MTTTSKTIGTFIATLLVGFFSVLIGKPNKLLKSKVKTTKTSKQGVVEEKENLFI